ncbi:MAG: ABC transporter substrate-binding protein [Planctomycetota bacterium]
MKSPIVKGISSLTVLGLLLVTAIVMRAPSAAAQDASGAKQGVAKSPPAGGQATSQGQQSGPAADATKKDAPKKDARYAATPPELEPYGRFANPYKRFFLEALEATGPGRDLPEPDVATVKIGLLAPFERTHEGYMGRPIYDGVVMAIDEANAEGGYKGKPFELVPRNDTGLWGASANEIARFAYDDDCWGIIGSVDSANTHIAIRVGLKIEIPIITPADTDPTFSETRIPWAFRNIPDDRQFAYTIAWHVFKDLGLERVAILRANNRYGRFGVSEFRAGAVRFAKPAPVEINYEVEFENVNPDFTAQLERLEATQPEGLVLWADADAAANVVKAIRAKGFKMPIFACERVVNPDFITIAGEAAEGVVGVFPFNPDRGDPDYEAFVKKYEERTGVRPLCYAAYAYDSTKMLVEAIRKAGLNRWKIRDALAEMPTFKGVTGESRMDLTLTNRASICLCTVKNGKWVFGEPAVTRVW